MITMRTRSGVTVLRPEHGDMVLVGRRGPDAATVLRDPGGVVTAVIRICAAKDQRRKAQEEKP